MRIGIHCSTAGSLDRAATKAHELGANTFQIFSASPRMWRTKAPDPEQIGRLKQLRERHDLTPLVIRPSLHRYLLAVFRAQRPPKVPKLAGPHARVPAKVVPEMALVTVYTTGPSAATGDVEVSLTWTSPSGYPSSAGPLSFSVDYPYALGWPINGNPIVPTTAVSDCGSPGVPPNTGGTPIGFWSEYFWQMESFFGQVMYGASMNENFVNVQDFQPTNLQPMPNGSNGVNGVATFTDNYCYANIIAGVPPSRPPQNPLGNNLIWSATQVYSVGSSTVGQGVPAANLNLSRYQDHDAVTNIQWGGPDD